MARLGQQVEIVALHGTVEVAALVGLADAIVDLTETGRTLSENRLRIVAEVGRSTARLIANQAALSVRTQELETLIGSLRGAVEGPPPPMDSGGV
jgi:ATP phosphoribosyltransferase